jgi:Protein of unknown function (DUF3108)
MKPGQPMAARPLVLLTLAVLALHLLVLRGARWGEPLQAAPMHSFITRVVETAAAPPPVPTPQGTVAQEPAPPRAPTLPRAGIAALPSSIDIAPAPAPAPVPEPHTSITAFSIPAPVRLRYTVTGQTRGLPWISEGQLLWRHDGNEYEASFQYATASSRSRSQSSTGRITGGGLAPQRFADKGRGERATHFERDSGSLVFSSNAPQVPLVDGTQDRLSVFLQLAAMFAGAPAKFPPGTEISLQTAGTRDAAPWLFTVLDDEELVLPGGTVATRKLLRVPRGDYDTRVELWLGTRMDYVPARIRLTQPNGDSVDHQWSWTDRP